MLKWNDILIKMKIKFHGAAMEVTGSKHLITTNNNKKILLDCGMHQGKREVSEAKNKKLNFNPTEIDFVLLSHAHIDHSGLLPNLIKNGFTGKIFCTKATKDILKPMLYDAAHIQMMDVEYFLKNPKLRKKAIHPIEPLYSEKDVDLTIDLIETIERYKKTKISDDIFITFFNAGHILGSSQILIESDGKKLGFTGDYGKKNGKIIKTPDTMEVDVLISETTYGDRIHKNNTNTREKLSEIINKTLTKNGKIIIPSFALERTQEIIYDLHLLFIEKKIPEIPVFIDSPLITEFTKIFSENIDHFNNNVKEFFTKNNKDPFSFKNLKHTYTTRESKQLNNFYKPCIIISASGMCEAGRIRHHLKNSIENPKNTIIIVGYQAKNTLGRKLVDGDKKVKIFDDFFKVNANIEILNGYSGHGDQNDLIENIKNTKGLKKVFLVHGEEKAIDTFKPLVENLNIETIAPEANKEYII